jgi:hypothetical protein
LLWETKAKWIALVGKWSDMRFSVIDPAAMTKEFCEHQTKANKSRKGLAGSLVADELKASVGNSDALLPLITDLNSFTIKQHFIQQITGLLGGNIFVDEQFRFSYLFQLRAFPCVDQIAAISGQVTSEQTSTPD